MYVNSLFVNVQQKEDIMAVLVSGIAYTWAGSVQAAFSGRGRTGP